MATRTPITVWIYSILPVREVSKKVYKILSAISPDEKISPTIA